MNRISRLACAAQTTRLQDTPPEVHDQASDLFLDTIAVISAGLTHPDYAVFAKAHCATSGEATVPGVPQGVPLLAATLVNGGATTVLQLQDGHRLARGHPASHLVPALLGVAQTTAVSNSQLLEAFIAGYEVGARIGIALGGFNPALHDTGTWSTVGAAVGVTHLLTKGNANAMAAAIEGAAAVAPMPYRETAAAGASVHHLYVGLGATTGVTAANGAVAGLTPLAGTLDAFFGPRAGAAFEPDKLTQGIDGTDQWSHYELMNGYIKVHPTCAHLHGVNDAVAHLISQHDLHADDVARVDVATYSAALEFENPHPANDLAARFSIPGSVAIALCHGQLTLASLTTAILGTAAVQDLMKRIYVSHDPKLDAYYPEGRPCRVDISCHDGRSLTASVVHPLGDCTNPLSRDARRVKARELLSARFGESGANQVVDAWDGAVNGDPLNRFYRALRGPAVN